ncbi:MAG: hypothetical protein WKF34_07335 [Pyrinomonadaceae bacterium]
MSKSPVKKLYCYVDETGQDAGSEYFVVVSIVSEDDQVRTRRDLEKAEKESKVHARKWYNSRSPAKEEFLRMVVQQDLASGDVYYAKFEKPLPFVLPLLETIEKAIKDKVGRASNSSRDMFSLTKSVPIPGCTSLVLHGSFLSSGLTGFPPEFGPLLGVAPLLLFN